MLKISCPDCGKLMVRVFNRFLGCSNYPTCKATLPLALSFGTAKPLERIPRPLHQWDKYQTAIFQQLQASKKHLMIKAVAGSSKTTVLVELVYRYLEQYPKALILLLAFNQHVVKELIKRLPENVSIATFHSFGYRLLKRKYKKLKFNNKKIQEYIDDQFPHIEKDQARIALRLELKLIVSFLKNLNLPATAANLRYLNERYALEFSSDFELLTTTAQEYLAKDLIEKHIVDYDDMLWLPLQLKCSFSKYDLVLVDEDQDLNPIQHQHLFELLEKKARLVAVGDENQAIYGFRGADYDSTQNLITKLQPDLLPLSISYRCPKTHVKLAQELVPQIEAHPNAIEGEIATKNMEEVLIELAEGDLVLCRTNAPLAKIATQLIRNNKKAVIRGKDIGQMLLVLLYQIGGKTIANFLQNAENYLNQLESSKKSSYIKAIEDRIETLQILSEGLVEVKELDAKICSIFSDDYEGIVCSTVHKAKGLEAENVYILRPDLLPLPYAQTPQQIQQELNVKYVALTRSKKRLVFVQEAA